MAIQPIGEKILIKSNEVEEKSKGGIILPDTAKEKSQIGTVVAVGEGKVLEDGKKVALEVKSGDKVLYAKYSGSEVEHDGVKFIILRQDDILAILK